MKNTNVSNTSGIALHIIFLIAFPSFSHLFRRSSEQHAPKDHPSPLSWKSG
jgi:hypothetical protein